MDKLFDYFYNFIQIYPDKIVNYLMTILLNDMEMIWLYFFISYLFSTYINYFLNTWNKFRSNNSCSLMTFTKGTEKWSRNVHKSQILKPASICEVAAAATASEFHKCNNCCCTWDYVYECASCTRDANQSDSWTCRRANFESINKSSAPPPPVTPSTTPKI